MPIIRLCLGPTYAWRHHRRQRPNVRSTCNSACLQKGHQRAANIYELNPWRSMNIPNQHMCSLNAATSEQYHQTRVTPSISNRFIPSIGWSKETTPLFDAVHCARIRYIIRLNEASDMTMLMIIAWQINDGSPSRISTTLSGPFVQMQLSKSWL